MPHDKTRQRRRLVQYRNVDLSRLPTECRVREMIAIVTPIDLCTNLATEENQPGLAHGGTRQTRVDTTAPI